MDLRPWTSACEVQFEARFSPGAEGLIVLAPSETHMPTHPLMYVTHVPAFPTYSPSQIFALKNGNRGRDGRVEAGGAAAGGLSYTVDVDKAGPRGGVWSVHVCLFLVPGVGDKSCVLQACQVEFSPAKLTSGLLEMQRHLPPWAACPLRHAAVLLRRQLWSLLRSLILLCSTSLLCCMLAPGLMQQQNHRAPGN